MKREIRYIFALIVFFSLFYIADKTLFSKIYHLIENVIQTYPLSFFLTYLFVGLPVLMFVFFSNKRKLVSPLGLRRNILKGVLISFIFSIPMFVGYGIMAGFSINISAKTFWFGCVFAAFFEELYYRGIFFGQLFKNTRLGFFPSLIVSALVFASLHLYQSNDLVTMIGIFITTFMGAGLFAWLYSEWDFNLWVPVSLHFFMNLSWEMFSVADNALGGLNAGLIRGLTIMLAIVGTIIYKKKRGIPLTVNKFTLWMKSKPEI
ncbi:MAG: CPBP family intramembrane metalloprotease [Bacteroidetes bacterium HGW-Bacteroidetes-9]|jgi:hypothetical protein|nr:MAG: CPBP family intramembrane metalloprotease [Bacteroidetes bacterium HGW-Bacteroidetes-9]